MLRKETCEVAPAAKQPTNVTERRTVREKKISEAQRGGACAIRVTRVKREQNYCRPNMELPVEFITLTYTIVSEIPCPFIFPNYSLTS